jgi:putative FmdB family regulatory protein
VPTYQYACVACGDQSEVVQKFTDEPLTVCERCGGRLRKVFSAVGIVFKGTGFYRTDSRADAKEKAGAVSKPNGAEADAKSAGDAGAGSKPGQPGKSDQPAGRSSGGGPAPAGDGSPKADSPKTGSPKTGSPKTGSPKTKVA